MWLLSVLLVLVSLLAAFIIIVLGLLLSFQLLNWYRYYSGGCNLVYAKERPFLGCLTFRPLHEEELHFKNNYGPLVFTSLFHLNKIICAEPEICQLILSKKLAPKSAIYSGLVDFWGLSLVTMNHGTTEEMQTWRKERALVNPSFKFSSLRSLHPCFERHSLLFVQRYLDALKRGKEWEKADFFQEFSKLTLEVISDGGFSFDIQAFEEEGNGAEFRKALGPYLAATSSPLLLFPSGGKILRWWHQKEQKVLDDVMFKVIDRRVEELKENNGKRDPTRKIDLLDLLLEAEDDGAQLSRTALRNELFIFYLAGHETSANIMSWTLHEIVRHPEVEQKLLDEINELMGKPVKGKIEAPTLDQIDKMDYLEMVFNETLRLYPPVVSLFRDIEETFTYNGHVFPKGCSISPSQFLIQRDERFWDNPLEFRPERFSKENSAGRHPFTFFPFGAGPRICIGKNFFYQESKVAFATLLRYLKFRADPESDNSKMDSSSAILRPFATKMFYSLREI